MHDTESGYSRMLAGQYYLVPDAELEAMQVVASETCARLNTTPYSAMAERAEILQEFLQHFGGGMVVPPIRIEYGRHLSIGKAVYINSNCTILDGAMVRIGDFCAIGPGVMILTAGHPLVPEERILTDAHTGDFQNAVAINHPITIEDHCWIGAGSIILGGVTIGAGTTVAAGSVVTRSLPPRVLAGGSPARVIREIPEIAPVTPGRTCLLYTSDAADD